MTTPLEFAKALLSAGGWPQSDNNLKAVVAWEALEGGHWYNTAFFNPMNTMQTMPGSHSFNNKPDPQVQSYPDWDTGLAATLKTLQNGLYNDAIDALAASADPVVTINSLKPWTGGISYNTSGIDALFQSYANKPDPTNSSLSSASGSTLKKGLSIAALGLLFGILWSKSK